MEIVSDPECIIASVPIAVGRYVRRMNRINEKIKCIASGKQNMPIIYCNTVQELLDEQ